MLRTTTTLTSLVLLAAAAPTQANLRRAHLAEPPGPTQPQLLRAAIQQGLADFATFFYNDQAVQTRIRNCTTRRHTMTCQVRLQAPDATCTLRAHARPTGPNYLYWQTRLRCRG